MADELAAIEAAIRDVFPAENSEDGDPPYVCMDENGDVWMEADTLSGAIRQLIGALALIEQRFQQVRAERYREAGDVEGFWQYVEAGWDIEPREFFEREARPMGFKGPLQMAAHHMWKRETKSAERDQQAGALVTLREALEKALAGIDDVAAQASLCAHHVVPHEHQRTWLRSEVRREADGAQRAIRAALAASAPASTKEEG
jgi:hypothetical protein